MDRSSVRPARVAGTRARLLGLATIGACVMALLAAGTQAATWRTTLHLEPAGAIADDRLDDIVAVEFVWATATTTNQVNTADLTDLTVSLRRETVPGACLARTPACRTTWSERVRIGGATQDRPGGGRGAVFWDAKQGIGFPGNTENKAFLSQFSNGGNGGSGRQYGLSDSLALPVDRIVNISVADSGANVAAAGYTAVAQVTERVVDPHDAQPLNSLFAPACCSTTDAVAEIQGYEFRVERDVLVSGLGISQAAIGTRTAGRVALWERNSGTLLASTLIDYDASADLDNAAPPVSGDDVAALNDGYRYEDATLFLRAGTTYVLAANITAGQIVPTADVPATNVNGAVTLLGPVSGLLDAGALVLPSPTGGFPDGTPAWPVNLRFTPSIFTAEAAGPLRTNEDEAGSLPLADAFRATPLPGNDHSQLANEQGISVHQTARVYQTVTVIDPGTLAGVVLALDTNSLSDPPGDIELSIARFAEGAPDLGNPVAKVALDPDLFGTSPPALSAFGHDGTFVDLSSLGVSVAADERLAIRVAYDGVEAGGTNSLDLGASSVDNYAGGSLFLEGGTDTDLGIDMAFRLVTREALEPQLVLLPAAGPFESIAINGGVLETVPAPDANGETEVTVQAQLGEETWASNLIGVEVAAVNDPPVATSAAPFTRTINEDAFANAQNDPVIFDGFFSDVDGDALTYSTATPNSDNPGLMSSRILYCNGSTCASSPNPATGHLNPRHFASLSANQNGTANLSVRVTDAAGESVDAVVYTYTVNPVNDAPVVAAPVADQALELGSNQSLNIAGVFDDVDIATNGDSLSVFVAVGEDSPGDASESSVVTAAVVSPTQLDLITIGEGAITVTLVAEDNAGATVADSFLVTVTAPPVPLVANDDIAGTEVGVAVNIDVLANDEGTAETPFFIDLGESGEGTVEVDDDNSILFTPADGFAGVAIFSYTLEEDTGGPGGGASSTATVQVLVNATPVAVDDNAGDTPINTPLRSIDVLANDLNLQDATGEGRAPTIAVVDPGNGRIVVNPDDTLYYEPLPGFFGIDTFSYTVADPDGDTSEPATVTVQVTATSGIPGPNVNIVGPTPDDPNLFPDTGLRQQNEVTCAMRADNPLHLFCGFNDYRGADDERVGDGWQGVAMSRDGGLTWLSRLAPGWPQYPGGAVHPDVRFAADPALAGAPGVMLFGFIASDRANKGPGGLFLQRWWENPAEVGYPWQPEAQTIQAVAGRAADASGPAQFIDKDHLVFFPATDPAAQPVVLQPTLEGGAAGGTRTLTPGTLAMAYAVFDGTDRTNLDFELPAFQPDSGVAGQQGFIVEDYDPFGVPHPDQGTAAVVELDPLAAADPEQHNVALRILPTQATTDVLRPGVFQFPAEPARIRAGLSLLFTPDGNGQLADVDIATPFATITIRNGALDVLPAGPLPPPDAGPVPEQGDGGPAAQTVGAVTADTFQRLRFEAETSAAGGTVNVFLDAQQIAGPLPFDPGAPDLLHLRVSGAAPVFVDAISIDRPTDARIDVVRSDDYGQTFGAPQTVSGADRVNQGAYLAAHEDELLVVWRRFNDPLNPDTQQTDAILWNHSSDRGASWSGPQVLADNICPFDQSSTADAFRSRAFPVAVHDGDTFHVFWSSRGFAPNANGQIDCFTGPARVVATSQDATGAWGAPAAVDPVVAGTGREFGHQFMPAAFAARGQVQLSWYDSRDDASASFGPLINDERTIDPNTEDALLLRHTLDVRTLRWDPANPLPSSRVTQMRFGLLPSAPPGAGPVPLERFYANGRIFRKGTQPFLGDYIAMTGPAWRLDGGTWRANNAPATGPGLAPPFFTAWADNRDLRGDVWEDLEAPTQYVRQPGTEADGLAARRSADPAAGTLMAIAPSDGVSDPPAAAGQCLPDEPFLPLTRNQNVYGAMIQPGFRVSTPTVNKTNNEIQRAYVIYLQNFSNQQRVFEASINTQPAPQAGDDRGRASFSQLPGPPYDDASPPPETTLQIILPPRSSAARTVYVTSEDDFPAVEVSVLEQQCEPSLCQGDAIILGAGGTALGGVPGLPADPTATEQHRPEVGDSATSVRTPGFENFDVEYPGFENPGFENKLFESPGFENPGFENPGFENPGFENVLFQNPGFENPGFENPGFENPGFENPGFENPGFENPGFENAPPTVGYTALSNDGIDNPLLDGVEGLEVVETVWPVTNSGNIVSSFNLSPFVAADLTAVRSQLLVTRAYAVPTVRDCQIVPELRHQVLVNIVDPFLGGVDTVPEGASQQGTDASLVSVFIQPGETLLVTLRVFREPGSTPGDGGAGNVAEESIGIAVIPQSCDTSGAPQTCEAGSDDPDKQPTAAVEGVHPVVLAFQAPVNAPLALQTSSKRIDRRRRQTLLPFTVRNDGTTAYVGKLRIEVTTNGTVVNGDGTSSNGRPVVTLLDDNQAVLQPGEELRGTIVFAGFPRRLSASLALEVKSANP